MIYEFPDDWYIEATGERLILDRNKVSRELVRLNDKVIAARVIIVDLATEIRELRAKYVSSS